MQTRMRAARWWSSGKVADAPKVRPMTEWLLGRHRDVVGLVTVGWRVHVVILLSVCVLMQMLGVPAPLLDAGGSLNLDEPSVLEGWSIPALCHESDPPLDFVLAGATQPLLRAAMFARSLFRPPLL